MKWEYKIVAIYLDIDGLEKMNIEGRDGWELVSVSPGAFKGVLDNAVSLIFKRPFKKVGEGAVDAKTASR